MGLPAPQAALRWSRNWVVALGLDLGWAAQALALQVEGMGSWLQVPGVQVLDRISPQAPAPVLAQVQVLPQVFVLEFEDWGNLLA